jgi:hypothetical protein
MDLAAYIEEDPKVWQDLQRYKACQKQGWAIRQIVVLEYVLLIKRAIERDDSLFARQLFGELDREVQHAIFVAPTYGGIFTTAERNALKGIE